MRPTRCFCLVLLALTLAVPALADWCFVDMLEDDGEIRRVPLAFKSLEVPFRNRKLWAMTIPWGDVASAFYSTGIPNIEVYTSASRKQIANLRRTRFLLSVLAWKPLQRLAQRWIERKVPGPSDAGSARFVRACTAASMRSGESMPGSQVTI